MTLASSLIGGALSGLVASSVGEKLEALFDDEAHFDEAPYASVVLRERICAAFPEKPKDKEFDNIDSKSLKKS